MDMGKLLGQVQNGSKNLKFGGLDDHNFQTMKNYNATTGVKLAAGGIFITAVGIAVSVVVDIFWPKPQHNNFKGDNNNRPVRR